jgi:hypothetical protein
MEAEVMGKPPQVSYVRSPAAGAWRSELADPQQAGQRLHVDSPDWFIWLAAPTTTGFSYPMYDAAHGYIAGFMTLRKERRQRGGVYWVAYHRCQGRVRKIYLGAPSRLTQACLDELAQRFLAAERDGCPADAQNGDS